MKCLLVTGASGFLGSYITRHFRTTGWRVVLGTRNHNETLAGDEYFPMFREEASLAKRLASLAPDAIIHCAGCASVPQSVTHPLEDFQAGPVLTFEILNALRQAQPDCRFIFLSSAAVYGNPAALPVSEDHPPVPLSPYGFHKLQSEQLCAEFATVYNVPTTSARIFSAYGAGLNRQVIWDICAKAIAGPIQLHGTGQESRDFIHATDVAHGLETILNHGAMRGETYNLSSGTETKISELASLILTKLGLERSVEFNGVVPPGTPLNWRADISRLKALGFSPRVSLEKGIEDVTRHFTNS